MAPDTDFDPDDLFKSERFCESCYSNKPADGQYQIIAFFIRSRNPVGAEK